MKVNTKNANRPDDKTGKYSQVINQINQDGVCPFCEKNLKKYHKEPIIFSSKNWLLTKNMYPYQNSKHHFLLIHKKHIEHIDKITKKAWEELLTILKKQTKKESIFGGSFFMRFGNTEYTGATVSHLHAHIVTKDQSKKESILVRLG